MKAKAPGKVVLSGAYAVLEGAPCIVTAVDRYVIADTDKSAAHIADEVRAAMPPPYPHIDANELRSAGRKIGTRVERCDRGSEPSGGRTRRL